MMIETSREVLTKIENNGFEAYIVGGFVRDYCMGKNSLDVDICTNATPKEISTIFNDAVISNEKYGSVTLMYKQVRFEITTFRKEIKYEDNRRPSEVQYIDSLEEDLQRRDFTINTLCMDKDGNTIDLLNGKQDINNKIVRSIYDPNIRLKEDVLRILRAVRFATILNFKIDNDLYNAIIKNRSLLRNLSYTRKKYELTRIFLSSNVRYGISLLCDLELDKYLELSNLKDITIVDDILGMWAQLKIVDIYPFSKAEKEIIYQINELLEIDKIDKYILYKHDFYIVSIVASIKGISKKEITKMYDELPIRKRKDIKITTNKICHLLDKKPGEWLKNVYDNLEKEIINGNLTNNERILSNYIINNKYIL